MRAATAAFADAIATSHQLASQATLLEGGEPTATIPIISGNVTLDQRAAVRGRCDITLVDDGTLGLVPTSPASALAPYGNEVRLERGVTYPDGTAELISVGIYRLEDVDVDDGPDGLTVRITGLDRAARVIDARFEEPYNVSAGENYATAIEDVISVAAAFTTNFAPTTHTTPALVAQEGDDRWAFAQRMAASIAMRLYFDGDGTLTLAPDVLAGPVATLAEGDGGVLLGASRNWKREGAFNRVIATGENTSNDTAPVRGVATDDNPLSPTYYYGPFGKVPRFYSSPLLTTDSQAASAAQAMLDRELGTTESVSFGSLVLPHLEPGDTVRVTRERSGIDEDHVIDSLSIPLTAEGVMSGQTRARQVLS